jgi:pimeloyl-ACP methyl ester carboxylesterase
MMHGPPDSSGEVGVAQTAIEFAHQSEKLSHQKLEDADDPKHVASAAHFVTPQDAVIETAGGARLPPVPLQEAFKLNALRDDLNGQVDGNKPSSHGTEMRQQQNEEQAQESQKLARTSMQRSMPPSHTNPLFPPLPLYGPPSFLRNAQCMAFRVSSFFLSTAFLGVIVMGSLFTSIPILASNVWFRATFRNPNARRPFFKEETKRKAARSEQDMAWQRATSQGRAPVDKEKPQGEQGFVPTEGGPDKLICDVGYYARRVGLDVEEFHVQTEDGFIIDLWHVYDPREYTRLDDTERSHGTPRLFTGETRKQPQNTHGKPKFPVLLMHGLLQSSGAYCCNDDDSLAFYLCKSGYDIWLGNNRCGFKPKHILLEYNDPRMWCWNIRQMGVFDLSALTSRVLYETGFEKVGLICHSQGTTQTFVALAKEQRPELAEKLTVFCALAPAAYAGPLIGKMYFKFMRLISPSLFRLTFGIHAFIPLMMTMHGLLPPVLYGWLGYKVFSFLFDWTDARWDRDLQARMFQFAPVYVSSESMRWWLGRECFAKHKCILSTKETWRAEEKEDEADAPLAGQPANQSIPGNGSGSNKKTAKGSTAWYNEKICPFALWVAGNDDLVDGRRLLRRFQNGREPHVQVVHSKVLPEFEHLDVIWAMDAPKEIFGELREVLWKTCNVRDTCRVPTGCGQVEPWSPKKIKVNAIARLEDEEEQSCSDAA